MEGSKITVKVKNGRRMKNEEGVERVKRGIAPRIRDNTENIGRMKKIG